MCVALFVAGWGRAGHAGARAFAIAALAPLATAATYLCGVVLKSVATQGRPCRAVTGTVTLLEAMVPPETSGTTDDDSPVDAPIDAAPADEVLDAVDAHATTAGGAR